VATGCAATIPRPRGSAHLSGGGFGCRLKQASARRIGRPSSTSIIAARRRSEAAAPWQQKGTNPLQVFVRDNNVDQALRILKKKMQREGVFREMKQRRFYEKPSTKATREKGEAVRRARKVARKQAIREGLIAAPPKKKFEPGRGRPGAPARPGAAGGHGPVRAGAR
jgi:small subunit ribosomal protein S21